MMFKRAILGSTSIVAAAVVMNGAAFAQREVSTGVDTITVTAQKREENSQDVPISVSGLDADAIEKTFARDIQDVESISPNLIIDPILGNGTAAISIRGMQLNDVEKSFDPAVAVYLDGVYLATTTGALLNVWDAERVEVLRGPQGTLFGRNTIGGLIHVQRKNPTGEFGGRLTATYGRFDQFDIAGRVDLPAIFNDALAISASVQSKQGGDYFFNTSRNEGEGDADYLGFNVSALFQPSDNFELVVRYDLIDDTTDVLPVTSLTAPGELFALFGGLGQPTSEANFHRTTTTTFEQFGSVRTDAITATPKLTLNDAHRIEGVFAWRDTEETYRQEFDGVAADLFFVDRPGTVEQLSGELRLHSSWGDNFAESVFGAYIWNSEYTLSQTTSSNAFFGVPMNPGDIVNAHPLFTQETDSWALFGQVDINLTDRLGLTLGGRYLEEEKTICGRSGLSFLPDPSVIVTTAQYGQDGFAFCDATNPAFQPTVIDTQTLQTIPFTGNDTWRDFTPKVGLTYDLDNALLFASYSEGFRSGGFNGRSTTAQNAGPYDPEKLTTYEAGFKSNLLDNRLQLNVAGFHNVYDNKQEDVVFADPGGVTVTVVENAAKAKITGAEAEVVLVPATGFTLSGSIGYLDARYDSYLVNDGAGNALDKSDFPLRRAPEWTFAVNALYEHELGNGHFIVGTANYSWRDDYTLIANAGNRAPGSPGLQDSYGLLDLSLNYETDNWRLSVFGKNVTGANYFLHVLDVGSDYVATSATDPTPVYVPGLWSFGSINPPARWGVEVDIKF